MRPDEPRPPTSSRTPPRTQTPGLPAAANELNTLSGPTPRGAVHAGVIIDDLILLELVPLSLLESPKPWPNTTSDVRMALADLASKVPTS